MQNSTKMPATRGSTKDVEQQKGEDELEQKRPQKKFCKENLTHNNDEVHHGENVPAINGNNILLSSHDDI